MSTASSPRLADLGVDLVKVKVTATGDKVHTEPVKLDTPGKATVEVIILQDRDDYEICLVESSGFWALAGSSESPEAAKIDWDARIELGAKD